MNLFPEKRNYPSSRTIALAVLSIGLLFTSHSFVTIETETITANGRTMVVRASSKLQGGRMYALPNMFDADSTTAWVEGTRDTRAGSWIEIRYSDKKRYRGLILGAGCRKDYTCIEDFSVPAKISIKLDEKPSFEYTMDWVVSQGTLSHVDANMRKAVLWFDSDTAFTTAVFQMKIIESIGGRKYLNLALSDFEPIDAYDGRFELLSVLSARTFNPNDIGVINSPVLFMGDDEPQWISRVFQDVYRNNAPGELASDSSRIEKGLNATMNSITDNAEIARLVTVLRKLLITDKRMPRFYKDGRAMTYMLFVGSIGLKNASWDIWRYITTTKTSRGLELTIRYIPFYQRKTR
jgi:hypothetical protein